MVKTFGESADFTAFKVVDGDIYRVAWAKTMQVDKTEDGQENESSLCDYMLERYDYKPSMDLVLNDILASGEQASMEEIREISEGLGAEPLWYMKNAMLAYIEKYDTSTSVNGFTLGGIEIWLSFEERARIRQSIDAYRNEGRIEMTKWFRGKAFTFPLDTWQTMLDKLSVYASEALNVTERHKAEVSALTSIEAVEGYNYKTGYPEKLSFADTPDAIITK